MFGSINKSSGLLFVTHDLDLAIRQAIDKMNNDVERLDENRFLNTASSDLKNYLIEKYKINPITLLRDKWYLDYQDVQIDVRNDSMRHVIDRNRPAMVPGERVEVRIPFEGDSELFYAKANTFTMNPPRAVIDQDKNEIVLRYDTPSDQPQDVRPLIDKVLLEIEEHIGWQLNMIIQHNTNLAACSEQAILKRRERLLTQSKRVEALGIPIRRKEDAPKTYTLPTIKKKAVPTLPDATTAEFKPEPSLDMGLYEHILKVIQDMALVMERSPAAFKTMDEESLRQHFLVQLNGQFEGQATGETFNMAGKTDILLRSGDRNVFIAECKFWRGQKSFSEAVDQLLSYATWRDGKTAILVFNRGTDTSTVLAGIDKAAREHRNFKRSDRWANESGYRYVLHNNGDTNREVLLSVIVFHVPQ